MNGIMIISFFRSKMYQSFILVPLLAAIPLITLFSDQHQELHTYGSPLASLIDTYLQYWPWLGFTFGLILLFIQSLFVSRICERHHLHSVLSNIPSLVILALYAGVTFFYFNLSFLIANTLLMICLDRILFIYNQPSIRGILFVSSASIGLAAILFIEYSLFILIIYVALFFFRKFNLREIIIPVIGFFTPFFYILVLLYRTDSLSEFINYISLNNNSRSINQLVSFTYWGFLLIAVTHGALMSVKTIRQKNQQNILLVALAISLFCQIVLGDFSMAAYSVIVPGSIFLGGYFSELKKKWVSELLFTGYVILLILGYVFFIPGNA